MKWLADACVDSRLVEALRREGCEIRQLALQESPLTDEEVLRIASAEDRVLLTDDKDFGDWVIHRKHRVPALVLVRIDPIQIELKISRVIQLYKSLGNTLKGKLLVVGPRLHRLRNL